MWYHCSLEGISTTVTNDLPTSVYCAMMWAQSDLYFYCTLLHTADPVKIASLNRFTSMLETLFDQEDQLSSDGMYTMGSALCARAWCVVDCQTTNLHAIIIHLDIFKGSFCSADNCMLIWLCTLLQTVLFSSRPPVQSAPDRPACFRDCKTKATNHSQ